MSVLYTSNTSAPVNVGSYVVTANPGLELPNAVDALDKLVGVSLTRSNTTGLSLASTPMQVSGTIPVIIPNSSTVATNGDITVTALASTYPSAWVWLPAGAVVGGAAGLYYTVFSSTTAGSVKTNYVNPVTTEFVPYVPAGTITAAVGSNSAYTTPTAATPLVNITLPANSVSPGSTLKTFCRVTCPNAADNKIVRHLLGTTSIGAFTFTTSTGGTLTTAAFSRSNAIQVLGSYGDSAIAATTFGAVDTTAAQGKSAPTFLVGALKDPLSGNLDRIQIIKGWMDKGGKRQEKVYDVVWGDADKRTPGKDGKLPLVGNTVNVAEATWTNTIGDPELITVWQDPDFDPKLPAVYYARVLEIPTPRWTAYEAKRFGIKLPPEVEMITQERAYTSPIWYTP